MFFSKTFLANAISIILNPIVLIYFIFIIGFRDKLFLDFVDFSSFFLLFFSLFLPVLFLYIISTFKIDTINKKLVRIPVKREDRNKFYLFIIFVLLFNIYVSSSFITDSFRTIIMFFVIYIGLMFFANIAIDKASMHASAFVLFVMVMIDKVSFWYFGLFILLPALFWARKYLHRHDNFELLLGTTIGLICGFLIWIL